MSLQTIKDATQKTVTLTLRANGGFASLYVCGNFMPLTYAIWCKPSAQIQIHNAPGNSNSYLIVPFSVHRIWKSNIISHLCSLFQLTSTSCKRLINLLIVDHLTAEIRFFLLKIRNMKPIVCLWSMIQAIETSLISHSTTAIQTNPSRLNRVIHGKLRINQLTESVFTRLSRGKAWG